MFMQGDSLSGARQSLLPSVALSSSRFDRETYSKVMVFDFTGVVDTVKFRAYTRDLGMELSSREYVDDSMAASKYPSIFGGH
jgi:hypothetical protein